MNNARLERGDWFSFLPADSKEKCFGIFLGEGNAVTIRKGIAWDIKKEDVPENALPISQTEEMQIEVKMALVASQLAIAD